MAGDTSVLAASGAAPAELISVYRWLMMMMAKYVTNALCLPL